MADIETIRECLQSACDVHGKILSEAMVKGWWECTKSVTNQQFEDAFWGCATYRLPKPSELLQAVAGISPADDWDVIMLIATGRAELGRISGFAANALRKIGGIKTIAAADESSNEKLHRQWLEHMQTAGSGLPMAEEEISLNPQPRGNVVEMYRPDFTGEYRANALINLLRRGEIQPKLARELAAGKRLVPGGEIPAGQRDRVLALIEEIEKPQPVEVTA
jgi:hypothetical protein